MGFTIVKTTKIKIYYWIRKCISLQAKFVTRTPFKRIFDLLFCAQRHKFNFVKKKFLVIFLNMGFPKCKNENITENCF